MDERAANGAGGELPRTMNFLTEAELAERLLAARDAALRRRSERLRQRAAFAATRCVGLQERHATKLARLDRQLSDLPDPSSPP
ncbi:MAG TPA: hypothetical protein VGP16_15460 [Asanoa sp.]|jgi:hypothetical protein|nr:hypothetical protein [Asanoa sp.]